MTRQKKPQPQKPRMSQPQPPQPRQIQARIDPEAIEHEKDQLFERFQGAIQETADAVEQVFDRLHVPQMGRTLILEAVIQNLKVNAYLDIAAIQTYQHKVQSGQSIVIPGA